MPREISDARLDEDFAKYWAEIRWGRLGHTHIQEDVVKRIYGAGWYDGGVATKEILDEARGGGF